MSKGELYFEKHSEQFKTRGAGGSKFVFDWHSKKMLEFCTNNDGPIFEVESKSVENKELIRKVIPQLRG